MDEQVAERVVVIPGVMGGKPVIRGIRIPVELIVRMPGHGILEGEILREYPRLQAEDIRAALAYAAIGSRGGSLYGPCSRSPL